MSGVCAPTPFTFIPPTLYCEVATAAAAKLKPRVAWATGLQSTQWLSDEAVTCEVPRMLKTPPGGGVRVSVHVTTCGCGDAAHMSSSLPLDDDEEEEEEDDDEEEERTRSRPPVLFSYDEAIVKRVRRLGFQIPKHVCTPWIWRCCCSQGFELP